MALIISLKLTGTTECHRRAVEEWLKTCQAVEAAEYNRDAARAILDKASADLLAACQDPHKSKPINKRGRKPKSKEKTI